MNEPMDINSPLVTEQVMPCPVSQVWDALIDENKMRSWYFPQLVAFRPIVGFQFKFADDDVEFHKTWQVLEVVDKEKLAHSWTYQGYPGNSTVCFELMETGGGTKLRVTHTGIASFPNQPHFARARFEQGWQTILKKNLKLFLENEGCRG